MIPSKLETIETNQAEGWAVARLGNLPLVTPAGAALDGFAEELAWAANLEAAGKDAVALAVLAKIQRRLGVTQDLHQAAVLAGGEVLAEAQRQTREARRRQALERAETLAKSGAAPDLSFGVTNSLELADAARADLERARAGKDRKGVKAAIARIRKYEARAARGRAFQLDQAWGQTAVAETLALATSRGEEVAVDRITVPGPTGRPERLTVTRIRSRDGLASLHASGTLSRGQVQAGMAFRMCYEARIASAGVANLEGASGGLAPHLRRGWERSGAELQRAYLMARLGQMEAVVRAGRQGPRRLRALRLVAGEGHCVRSVVKGGDARERLTQALVEALDQVAAILGLANQGR